MNFFHLSLVLLALASFSTAADDYRLPTTAIPSSYNLTLSVDPEQSTYNGTVSIALDIILPEKSENTFYLHAADGYINITKVTFEKETDNCNVTSVDKVTDKATISCKKDINGTNKVLELDFAGVLASDDMFGLYKTSYVEDEKTKTLAATQFESSHARKAFPCFDEPRFKAEFNVMVTAPKKYTVWGNTAVKSVAEKDGLNTTIFQKTPKMSTYLVALLVSEFQASESKEKKDYKFSVVSRAGAKDQTSLAVKYGPMLLDKMGQWTGIPYASLGNAKQDLAAIPEFAAGAMENWGLVTYREETLLDEQDRTSNSARQTIITVIAHELAHQWFGDYVTMNWWSELWLNEGFATYFEYMNANDVDDTLKLELDNQFVNLVHQIALTADSVASALPLSNKDEEINNLAEQSKKFDHTSYEKGGSVIRMIKYILGETLFKQALNTYLTENKHSNATAEILLKYFDKVAPKADGAEALSTYLNSWIYKPGHPILNASVDVNGTVTIDNKKRYLLTGENDTEWYVPLTFTTSDNINFDEIKAQWVKPNGSYEVKLKNKDDWIILNLQSSGFYRVNYDNELWSRIINALNNTPEKIHVLNRAVLLNDIFNIAKIGDIDYNTTLNLANYIAKEKDYYPWYSFLTEVDSLLLKIKDDATKKQLMNNTLELLSNVIEIPTGKAEDLTHIKVLQRSLILKWACKLGHQGCVDYAKAQFEKYKKNNSDIDTNLRSIILCYGFKNSTDQSADYDSLFKIYPSTTSPYEKNDVLNALACSSNKTILEKYLQTSIDENSSIKLQDTLKVFRYVLGAGSEGLSVALEFLDKNMEGIIKRYKGLSTIDTILTTTANYVVKDEDITKFKKILDDNKSNAGVQTSGTQALEIVNANKKWSDAREKGLTSALLNNGEPTPAPGSSAKIFSAALLVLSIFVFVF